MEKLIVASIVYRPDDSFMLFNRIGECLCSGYLLDDEMNNLLEADSQIELYRMNNYFYDGMKEPNDAIYTREVEQTLIDDWLKRFCYEYILPESNHFKPHKAEYATNILNNNIKIGTIKEIIVGSVVCAGSMHEERIYDKHGVLKCTFNLLWCKDEERSFWKRYKLIADPGIEEFYSHDCFDELLHEDDGPYTSEMEHEYIEKWLKRFDNSNYVHPISRVFRTSNAEDMAIGGFNLSPNPARLQMNNAITIHFSYSECGNQSGTYDCFAVVICNDLPLTDFILERLDAQLNESFLGMTIVGNKLGCTKFIITHNIPKENVDIWQEVIKSRISSAKLDYYLKHTEEAQLSVCVTI